ncbi:MAG: protein kinase [Deltaproteobacteria bacterium]|nr:protein kinase [Deltaproteobacteria bacterium]
MLQVEKNQERIPDRLGRYAILKSLARGGMAQVYVAQKDGADEICVLKQLLVELEEHETAAKRFHREAHVASFLIHPNIARVTDAGMQGDAFCIAMEFIAGKDVETMMHTLMRDGRMLPHEVSLAVALGALEGLSYAHDATDPSGEPLGLVHRDLSPRNIMLSFSGDVKLIDFGLAHGRLDDFKTAPGMILGTLRYVSPEQAMTQAVDRRSDLYSLGVVLHEMLTGRFLVPHGKPVEVLKAVVGKPAPTLSELNPHLPKAMDAVLLKALDKDPSRRFQSAAEFSRALRGAAGALAETPPEMLGDFVEQMFPEDLNFANELVSMARRRARSSRNAATATLGEEDLGLATRGAVSPRDLAEGDAGAATRSGYTPDDAGSRTRTAMVTPRGMDGSDEATRATRLSPAPFDSLADIGMATRTVVVDEETRIADPSDQSTAVVRRKGSAFRDPIPIPSTISVDPPPPSRRRSMPLVLIGGGIGVLAVGILIGRLMAPPPPAQPITAPSQPVDPAPPGAVTGPQSPGAVAPQNPTPAANPTDPGAIAVRVTPEPTKPDVRPTKAPPSGALPVKSKVAPDKQPEGPAEPPAPKDPPVKPKKDTMRELEQLLREVEFEPTFTSEANAKYSKLITRLRAAVASLPPEKQKTPNNKVNSLSSCVDITCATMEDRFRQAKDAVEAVRGAGD